MCKIQILKTYPISKQFLHMFHFQQILSEFKKWTNKTELYMYTMFL